MFVVCRGSILLQVVVQPIPFSLDFSRIVGHLDKVKVPNQERTMRPSKRNWLSLMPYLLGVSLITLLLRSMDDVPHRDLA